jgi:hypothetical protein
LGGREKKMAADAEAAVGVPAEGTPVAKVAK